MGAPEAKVRQHSAFSIESQVGAKSEKGRDGVRRCSHATPILLGKVTQKSPNTLVARHQLFPLRQFSCQMSPRKTRILGVRNGAEPDRLPELEQMREQGVNNYSLRRHFDQIYHTFRTSGPCPFLILTTTYVWSKLGQRALHSSMFSPTNYTLPPLSPQPPLKPSIIQPFSSLPPRRSPKIPVVYWILHLILDFPRLRAITPLANYSRFVSPLHKNARLSLVAISDADLEGVIVKPSNRGTSTTITLVLEDLK